MRRFRPKRNQSKKGAVSGKFFTANIITKNWPNSARSSTEAHDEVIEQPLVEIEERVRYSEVDQFGVAHNKHYFDWFEIGRTEFCRQKGIPYKEIEKKGFFLVVVAAFCRYRKPLRYDDCFIIQTACREAKPKKIVFDYRLLSSDRSTIIAEGYTVHVPVNSQAEVTPLPHEFLSRLLS